MADAIIAVVLFAITMLSILWLMRASRKNATSDAAIALVRTLELARREEIITANQCVTFFKIWDHYLGTRGDKGVNCACRAVKLHCEDDACIRDDIEHTTKFCDVVAKGDA